MGFELGFGKKKEKKPLTKEEQLRLEARKKETVEELRQKHISELTEEQIVEIGLKTHTKTDKLCFFLMVIMFFMIFVPPIFRKVFFDPDLAITERETVYLTLTCSKRRSKGSYTLNESMAFTYRDGEILNLKVDFRYTQKKIEGAIPTPQEIERYLNMEKNIFDIKKLDAEQGYEIKLDFEANPEFKAKEELKEFAYSAPAQTQNMPNLGYSCIPSTKRTIRTFRGEKLIKEEPLEEN